LKEVIDDNWIRIRIRISMRIRMRKRMRIRIRGFSNYYDIQRDKKEARKRWARILEEKSRQEKKTANNECKQRCAVLCCAWR
jgi:hypothetical protein